MGQVIMMAEDSNLLDAGPPPEGLIEAVEESMQQEEKLDSSNGAAEPGELDESSMVDAGPPPAELVAEIGGEFDEQEEDEAEGIAEAK